jgi:DNA-binding NarL/FixJ family response regulator
MPSNQSPGGEIIRVLVADDTQIHTQLLADAMRRDQQLEVITAPVRSRDLIETVKVNKVSVVVLSSNLDEEPLRGFELLRQLRQTDPAILAIMLLDSSRREAVLQAFRAGARGIFSRHDSVETLSKCIRSVFNGQIWANGEQIAFAVEALASSPVVRAVDSNGLSLLSKREMDVVRSLAEGLTNREIGERLGLSQHTIKNYLFRVYDKLGVSSRLELLFMTLTQPGAPQSGGRLRNVSKNGHENLHPAKPSPIATGFPDRSSSHGRSGLASQVPASPSPQKTRQDGAGNREQPWGSKSRPGSVSIGADPLD